METQATPNEAESTTAGSTAEQSVGKKSESTTAELTAEQSVEKNAESTAAQLVEKKSETSKIKAQVDEVLMKHIKRLIEIETLSSSISFNLSTITCLLLIVERENDIKSSSDSSMERYTKETFLDEISDVGVDIDDTLMASLQALTQHGYMMLDSDNRYNAQISTFAIVGFLDNLFPGMRGMNLVAYILQTIEEITSGRKEFKVALEQLDQTLLAKGIPLSKQTLGVQEKGVQQAKAADTPAKKTVKAPVPASMSKERKQTFGQNLSKLRAVSNNKRPLKETKIKELVPKGPTEEEIKAQEAAREAEKETAEKAAREIEAKEAELAAKEAEINAAQIAAREAEIKAKEAEIRAREAEIAAREVEATSPEPESEPEDAIQDAADNKGAAVDIEKQIAAFQEQIAITCPICQTGKVGTAKTEKDQEYYSCSDANCGFISWDKPYPFECPICKNQFIVEFTGNDGKPGLKCPKNTCSFRQDHLNQPHLATEAGAEPKKRRKLLKRKRKKK